MNKYIDVVIFKNVINIDRLYTYENSIKANVGDFVIVDFNNSLEIALVLKSYNSEDFFDAKNALKIVNEINKLDDEYIKLGLWMREFYILTYAKSFSTICDLSIIKSLDYTYENSEDLDDNIKLIINDLNEGIDISSNELRKINKLVKDKKIIKTPIYTIYNPENSKYYQFNEDLDISLNKIRKNANRQISLTEEIYFSFFEQKYFSSDDVMQLLNYQKSLFDELINKNIFSEIDKDDIPFISNSILLNDEQKSIVKSIQNSSNNKFLIQGVTGSGKTEIYFELIEEMLKENKSSIFLVPEIGLTPQMELRTRNRFGNLVSIIHSKLSTNKRIKELNKIKNGESKILLGTRSAIFTKMENLGLIIIDEEHDNSYKLDSNNKYDTRDVARFLVEQNKNIKLVLGSATPSIESYFKGKNNIYDLFTLNNRPNNYKLPEIIITDMKDEIAKGNTTPLSFDLLASIKDSLHKNNQSLLFLNRRGYSTSLTCTNCGETVKCTKCDISMVYHKNNNFLKCHYCGETKSIYHNCFNCGNKKFKRLGLGTEKLEEIVKESFIDFNILRIDSDTTSSNDDYKKNVEKIQNNEVSIILGTQMITKGFDFPNIDTVGVITADLAFAVPEYDSSEKAFQVLMQVAGRSGRSENPGKVIIQTFNPNHYILKHVVNHNYLGYFEEELYIRKLFEYPPFKRQFTITILNRDLNAGMAISKNIIELIEQEIIENNLHDNVKIISNKNNLNVTRINNRYNIKIFLNSSIREEKSIKKILYKLLIKNEKNLDLKYTHIDVVSR